MMNKIIEKKENGRENGFMTVVNELKIYVYMSTFVCFRMHHLYMVLD